MEQIAWYRFGVALAIGALVGLERQVSAVEDQAHRQADDPEAQAAEPEEPGKEQWDKRRPAGLRTFMLVGLGGAVAAEVTNSGAPWAFAAALLVLGTLTGISYSLAARRDRDLGVTSEVSLLLVFMLGGLCVLGDAVLAAACGVFLSVVLSLKADLHRRVDKIAPADVHATLKFAVLTVIVLPILPGEPLSVGELLGTSDASWWTELAINPRKVWLMVVLISGVSFAGYVLGKRLGASRGLLVTGAFGGLASSTAVSLSFSQRSHDRPEASRQLAAGILLANALMPVRLLLVTSVLAPSLLAPSAIPLLGMTVPVFVALGVLLLRESRSEETAEVKLENPFRIGPALKFGAIFGVVLLLAQALERAFGDAGLYALAVVTGLTDVDAIGLTVAGLVADGDQAALAGATLIALAAISNTVVKGGFVAVLGSPALRREALGWFVAMIVACAAGIGATRALF